MSQNTRATTHKVCGLSADHCLDLLCRDVQISMEGLTRLSREAARILNRAGVNLDPRLTISEQAEAARRRGETWGIALCRLLDQFDPGHCEKQPVIHGLGGEYTEQHHTETEALYHFLNLDLARMLETLAARSKAEGLPDPRERIISGYRSPTRQRMLREAWDRGDREGLIVRPAENSKHSEGKAVDLRGTLSELTAWGRLWEELGGTWGGRWFPRADRGHFQIS